MDVRASETETYDVSLRLTFAGFIFSVCIQVQPRRSCSAVTVDLRASSEFGCSSSANVRSGRFWNDSRTIKDSSGAVIADASDYARSNRFCDNIQQNRMTLEPSTS